LTRAILPAAKHRMTIRPPARRARPLPYGHAACAPGFPRVSHSPHGATFYADGTVPGLQSPHRKNSIAHDFSWTMKS
jgi:hypothetical protein